MDKRERQIVVLKPESGSPNNDDSHLVEIAEELRRMRALAPDDGTTIRSPFGRR